MRTDPDRQSTSPLVSRLHRPGRALAAGMVAAVGVMGTGAGMAAGKPEGFTHGGATAWRATSAAAAPQFPPQEVCHRGRRPGRRALAGLTAAERASVTVTRACVDDLTGGIDVTAHLGGNLSKVVGHAHLRTLLFAALITRKHGVPVVIGLQPGRLDGLGISDRSLANSFFAYWLGNDLVFEVTGIKLADVTAVRLAELPAGLPRSGHRARAADLPGLNEIASAPEAPNRTIVITIAKSPEVDVLEAYEREHGHVCQSLAFQLEKLRHDLNWAEIFYHYREADLKRGIWTPQGLKRLTQEEIANDPELKADASYASVLRAQLAAVEAKLPCPPVGVGQGGAGSTPGGGGTGGGTSKDAPPIASFVFSPNNPPSAPKAGQTVAFDGSGSSDRDGTVIFWTWAFGGALALGGNPAPSGSPSAASATGKTASASFSGPGVFPVTLTVTDNGGQTSSTTQNVYVSGAGTKPAALTDVPCSGAVGGYVDINIPSYGQNPTASLTSQLTGCPGEMIDLNSIVVTFVQGAVQSGGSTIDEWGRTKNHLHITYNFSGTSSATGPGSATFTASWS